MRTFSILALALVPAFLVVPAEAQTPQTAKAGAETKVLTPLVGDFVRSGEKTPPMRSAVAFTGTAKCVWTANVWVSCDVKDKHAEKAFPDLSARLVVGWDFMAKEYRGFFVSSIGASMVLEGKKEGERVVLESGDIQAPMGKMRARLTFDFTDPKAPVYLDERSINGLPWVTFERSTFRK